MAAPLCRIAHLSDLHVGRLACPGIDQALLRSVNEARPDLVAVTGDLVQRAHRWQYRRAARLLAAIEAPLMVIPGNHDLYSWIYRPVLRMTVPLGRYRRTVTGNLTPTWRGAGMAVLGISTATPWTIQRGRCTPAHAQHIRACFAGELPGTCKVLAVHHPVTDMDTQPRRDVAQGAAQVRAAVAAAGVELILCGHWHLSHAWETCVGGHAVVVSLAGTATSDRYRAPQIARNAYNMVALHPGRIVVREWRYHPGTGAFVAGDAQAFARGRPTAG